MLRLSGHWNRDARPSARTSLCRHRQRQATMSTRILATISCILTRCFDHFAQRSEPDNSLNSQL